MSVRALGGGLVHSLYEKIISLENLFGAWKEFRRGKGKRKDVLLFEFNLEDNIFKLHDELLAGRYLPDPYVAFFVRDPKLRHIHKASVRDRVLHQAIFSVLYEIFDKRFIFDSFSSRKYKGTHLGSARLEKFLYKATSNWTHGAYALKCDIRKFFDSVNHNILFSLIKREIEDDKVLALVGRILGSFEKSPGRGLPLGNVTSQLFANIYMNEFDQYIKNSLKAKWYVRYCDDFVILDKDRIVLENFVPEMRGFLLDKLDIELHPNKISLRKARQGTDFLGYVILPHRKVLRTKTKIRILKRVTKRNFSSYKGILSHCKGRIIERAIDRKLVKGV